MFPQKQQKSLEEVIKELHNKHKNKPSPLSENYNKANENIHFSPTQKSIQSHRSEILGDFRPMATRFGMPL